MLLSRKCEVDAIRQCYRSNILYKLYHNNIRMQRLNGAVPAKQIRFITLYNMALETIFFITNALQLFVNHPYSAIINEKHFFEIL